MNQVTSAGAVPADPPSPGQQLRHAADTLQETLRLLERLCHPSYVHVNAPETETPARQAREALHAAHAFTWVPTLRSLAARMDVTPDRQPALERVLNTFWQALVQAGLNPSLPGKARTLQQCAVTLITDLEERHLTRTLN